MPDDLDHISPNATENKQIAGMRVPSQRLLDLYRQTVHAPAHVRPPHRQPDPRARRKRDHDRTNAFTIADASSGETVGGNRT